MEGSTERACYFAVAVNHWGGFCPVRQPAGLVSAIRVYFFGNSYPNAFRKLGFIGVGRRMKLVGMRCSTRFLACREPFGSIT